MHSYDSPRAHVVLNQNLDPKRTSRNKLFKLTSWSISLRIKAVAKLLLILLLGAALSLSFTFPSTAWIIPVVLAVWLHVLTKQNDNLSAGIVSFTFGMGFFTVGIYWVFISIHDYGNTSAFIAVLITALFIFILSLFPTTAGLLTYRTYQKHPLTALLCLFPSAWLISEWIRSYLFTGFPWLLLGHSQVSTWLGHWLPLLGVYGTSGIVCLSATLLLQTTRNQHFISGLYLTVLLLLSFMFQQIQWTKPMPTSIQVSLVQGNVPQQLKWDERFAQATLDRYANLTQHALTKHSQWIIFPEAALPINQIDGRDYLNWLDTKAKQQQSTLFTGIPFIDEKQNYYNSLLMLGQHQGSYHKQHLVPFGEYVPWTNLLRGIIGFFDLPMSDFKAVKSEQALLKANNYFIAPFICYEIAYSDLVRQILPKANLLLVVSNDAWFGRSSATTQHLQIAQAQALQTGRPVLFVSNTGITAIINPQGTVQSKLPDNQLAMLTDVVHGYQGRTPWSYYGDTLVLGVVMLMLIASMRAKIFL